MEAGYKGEPIVIMDLTDCPDLHPPAIIVAQELRDIGINVDLQAMDWATFPSRRADTKPSSAGGWHIFSTWMADFFQLAFWCILFVGLFLAVTALGFVLIQRSRRNRLSVITFGAVTIGLQAVVFEPVYGG
jgi:ABC-type transport system substrate-binding protein